jgi:hypothetical protein
MLRLFEWSKDSSARTQRQTHAHVWIRLVELPQEYWMERTLREITSAIGTPLRIDSATQNRVFGHYARVLVDTLEILDTTSPVVGGCTQPRILM